MKDRLKKNYIVLIVACFVGFVSVAPSLFARINLGAAYKGIPYFLLDDEYTYTSRIQEIIDGHLLVGSPFFYEGKDVYPLMPPLGEHLYALPARLGLAVVQSVVLMKFFLPALLFFLAYLLFRLLIKDNNDYKSHLINEVTAISAGMLVALLYNPIEIVLKLLNNPSWHISIWTRPINPILGAITIFIFLILFLKTLVSEKRKYILLSGLVLGTSVFYFFGWGLIISILTFSLILFFLQKNWRNVNKILYIFLVGLLASVPSLILIILALQQKGSGSAERFGMLFTHMPTLNKFSLTGAVIFIGITIFIIIYRKQKIYLQLWWQFSFAIVLGLVWVYIQNIITGISIWPDHFLQFTNPLIFFILMLIGYKLIIPYSRKIWLVIVVLTLLASSVSGIFMARSYNYQSEDFKKSQNQAEITNWINENTTKDCVIYVLSYDNKSILHRRITALTHCNIYDSIWKFTMGSVERLQHNYFIFMQIQGVEVGNAKEFLWNNKKTLNRIYFKNWHELFQDNGDDWYNSVIEHASKEYEKFTQASIADNFRKYKIDYLISEYELDENLIKQIRFDSEPVLIQGHYIYHFSK